MILNSFHPLIPSDTRFLSYSLLFKVTGDVSLGLKQPASEANRSRTSSPEIRIRELWLHSPVRMRELVLTEAPRTNLPLHLKQHTVCCCRNVVSEQSTLYKKIEIWKGALTRFWRDLIMKKKNYITSTHYTSFKRSGKKKIIVNVTYYEDHRQSWGANCR